MLQKILSRNKKKFLEYNNLRKQLFVEFAPKDSELVLYLLPWLISINHPDCPGYIPDLTISFRVCNVGHDKNIKHREEEFKKMFGVSENGSLLKLQPRFLLIQGLYTIGSAGTISQTPESDCDIWVCYDGEHYNPSQIKQLHHKMHLIKEWIDYNCKIPVYFFVSDVQDIRKCRFGTVDEESSGSTQTNVLKEEFYRTCVVICGKIPLWWVCYDPRINIPYDKALATLDGKEYFGDEFIDLGNLENVNENEYFGAALWQLHKSLAKPLKSIIKMLILKMQLDAPDDELICHKFRQHVTIKKLSNMIPDPSVFSMFFIMNYFQGKSDSNTVSFVKECFYLRCEIKVHAKKKVFKQKLTDIFFNQFKIDLPTQERLQSFSKWDLESQIKFGKRIFMLLLQIYSEISDSHSGVSSKIEQDDLTVLGRKIQAFYEAKDNKVAVLPKPLGVLNVSELTIQTHSGRWHVSTGSDKGGHILSHKDILFVIAFIAHNKMFETGRIHMLPNRSSISLTEILTLGTTINDFFSGDEYEIISEDYLNRTYITKMLVVISFEQEPAEKNISNIGLIYRNSWGELFVRRFNTEKKIREFLKKTGYDSGKVVTEYYLQRKCINYSVILSSVKTIMGS